MRTLRCFNSSSGRLNRYTCRSCHTMIVRVRLQSCLTWLLLLHGGHLFTFRNLRRHQSVIAAKAPCSRGLLGQVRLTLAMQCCDQSIGKSVSRLDIFASVCIFDVMPRLHLIHVARIQVVSTCVPCRRLHVSCIGDKTVVTATCIHLYPRVEHCLELVSGYMQTDISCSSWILVQTATCTWCKRGLKRTKQGLSVEMCLITDHIDLM